MLGLKEDRKFAREDICMEGRTEGWKFVRIEGKKEICKDGRKETCLYPIHFHAAIRIFVRQTSPFLAPEFIVAENLRGTLPCPVRLNSSRVRFFVLK